MFLARGHLPVGFNLECEELYVYKNSEVEITTTEDVYDFGLFTSKSSVERFKKANNSKIHTFISIGKHTSKAIREYYGDVSLIEVKEASKKAMIQACLKEAK